MNWFSRLFGSKKTTATYTAEDLIRAVEAKKWSDVPGILAAGVSPDIRTPNGMPVFHLVAASLNSQAIFHFLDHGVDLLAKDSSGATADEYCLSVNEVRMSAPSEEAWHVARSLAKRAGKELR